MNVLNGAIRSSYQGNSARKQMMQKIMPFLWFDGQAGAAAKFYASIFPGSKVESISPMTATFRLAEQKFIALNGGPQFKFTEAISFYVSCPTQKEIDYFWEKLSAGGKKGRCGWLKDPFGVSWQVVPPILGELLSDRDKEKSDRVMQAMLRMNKLDIKTLKEAYTGNDTSGKTTQRKTKQEKS
jgi:predicted 3-demethylubiquinone-9 3-methyltransferase (glyoxalase superfamily)